MFHLLIWIVNFYKQRYQLHKTNVDNQLNNKETKKNEN